MPWHVQDHHRDWQSWPTVKYKSDWGDGEFLLMRTTFEVDNLDYEAFPCQGREFIFRRSNVGDNAFILIAICRNLDMGLDIIDKDWELAAYGKAGRPKDSESEVKSTCPECAPFQCWKCGREA